MTLRCRVLVTDAEQRAGLAVVRSLGRCGHDVRAVSHRQWPIAGSSRYCRRIDRVPDPIADPGAYVETVRRLAREQQVDVLIPITEASLLAILPERRTFDGVVIPFADAESFRAISNKELVLEQARRLGIAVPAQTVLSSIQDAGELDVGSLCYPLVVKPARSVGESERTRRTFGVAHVQSARDLERVLADMPASAYPLLVQQRIVGSGTGIFLLSWDDALLAVFAHRRLREKPPSGGVSVYSESIAADESLVASSRALLDRFDWRGVAMVEYKIDAATGTPYLMEINGRFWGSLQLAIDSGVDFPAILVDAAMGEPARQPPGYRTGQRNRWWWGDVDHLIARLLKGAYELDLPPDAPSRTRVVLEFLRLWRPGERNEVLRADDPGPFFRETLLWLKRQ